MAKGFNETDATDAEGEQLLEPRSINDVEVTSSLTPETFGWHLDPAGDLGKPVVVGRAATIDGHSAESFISGKVTTYVSSGHIVRVVDENFDVQVAPMTSDDVARFYSDLQPTVTALDDASNTETRVDSTGGWSNPCGPACTAIETLTSTPHPFLSITMPGYTIPVDNIFVSYQIVLTINGVVTPRPDCSGVVEIPGNGTTTLSCSFTAGPGSQVNASLATRPVLGRAAADILVKTLGDNAERSRDKTACPATSVRGSTGC